MSVYLINPSHVSFGIGVITPRWLYVLASATPAEYGAPVIVDETLEQFDFSALRPGDIVGIGIHTGNALRGYEIGTAARAAGATVVFGGIHATLYPDEPPTLGGAHVVVTGDGERAWPHALRDCVAGTPLPVYDGGRIGGEAFLPGRWDLLPEGRYMWASVQTVRGCPKHCSFCSVWRTDGQQPRQRHVERVLEEIVDLRRRGFRFIALADDNFYPVTLEDLRMAGRRQDPANLERLTALRNERFELMQALQANSLDFVMPDVQRIGGVTGWLRAAAIAHAHGVEMSSHLFPEYSAHLLAVTPTAHYLEYMDWADPILHEPIQIRDGHALIPDRPGSGVTWDEAAVQRYLAA